MESGGDEGLPRLLVFPGSLSSWRALIVAEELQVKVKVETVNMFLWEHLKPEHLALAPQGTIPTLVLPTGRSLIGQELLEGLQQLSSSTSPGVCFKGGQDWEEKLGQVSISAMTHGLSLHPPPRTLTLRYPYHEQDYCNMASNHILSRADRLLEAADRMRGSRGEVAEGLVRIAETHQASLAQYLEPRGYETVLQSFHQLLEDVEQELAREGRQGCWLGGGFAPSIADITLGLYLHRLWQLGMEGEYFEEGVRPHLSVFYQGIRERPSFLKITRWKRETGNRTIKSETDALADNAKMGIGAAAVLGGLFLVKKFMGK